MINCFVSQQKSLSCLKKAANVAINLYQRFLTEIVVFFASNGISEPLDLKISWGGGYAGLMNTDYTKFFTSAARHFYTRNSDTNNFDAVATHRQTNLGSSFFPRSVNIWNNLPSALKNYSSLPSLKTALSNLYLRLSKLPSYQPP